MQLLILFFKSCIYNLNSRYNTDNEFRKIKPDIEKVFNEVEFTIKFMDNLSDLPGEVKTIGHE